MGGNSPEIQKQLKIGIDTGGTFTDFVWLEDGRLRIHKQLSTPADPALAVLDGISALDVPLHACVVHGSTVATNALLERRGARTALITTAGFADVLAIGRQNRPDLYALVPQKPEPLVPRQWRFEVPERVTAQGGVLRPLDAARLQPILNRLERDRVESVAVCLLFSFLHPEHERAIRDWLLAHGGHEREASAPESRFHISLSSDLLPEYREYERTATTVINAYVAPLMTRYLTRLAEGIAPRTLLVMQSNGGIIRAVTAGHEAARTVLSGPAGGVVGAQFVAEQAGYRNIISFDMGGTSTDVALCPSRVPTTSVGEIAGLPLRLPIIDIHTVGAGGGSLAYVDAGGALHVGPQSAGADPGPICYGRTTMRALAAAALPVSLLGEGDLYVTTTDANLVLGRLSAQHFLGGRMQLYVEPARMALAALAEQLGVATPEAAAWDVLQVANAIMERAIRHISIERGYDPRDFTLVAFGGAGPLHACELARRMQIPRVLVPPVPGVLSALGMLVAAPTKDYLQTVMRVVEAEAVAPVWLQEAFAPLEERARAEMAEEGYGPQQVALQHRLDMRYVGQSHELTVPFHAGTGGEQIVVGFHRAHEQRYGYRRDEAPVEIVNVRLTAAAPALAPTLPKAPGQAGNGGGAVIGTKPVWFEGQAQPTALYLRSKLPAGYSFRGPAIVFQYDTTTVIPADWRADVDAFGNLILSHVSD